MATPPTTTSYAMLYLYAVRSWTAYELAQQMDRSVGNMWPRAASVVYEEPKRLVALGYARAKATSAGKRPSTTYGITAKGRRALQSLAGATRRRPGHRVRGPGEGGLRRPRLDRGLSARTCARSECARKPRSRTPSVGSRSTRGREVRTPIACRSCPGRGTLPAPIGGHAPLGRLGGTGNKRVDWRDARTGARVPTDAFRSPTELTPGQRIASLPSFEQPLAARITRV